MPGSREYGFLIRNFSIQEFLADTDLPKHRRSRRCVKSSSPGLITGIRFMPRSQIKLVEAARVNDRMAADAGSLLFHLAKKREIRVEKKCLAVGVIHVL